MHDLSQTFICVQDIAMRLAKDALHVLIVSYKIGILVHTEGVYERYAHIAHRPTTSLLPSPIAV